MLLVCVILWGINVFASLIAGRQSWQTWKSSGAEEQAHAEATSAAASLAAKGAQAAVQAQVSQATGASKSVY